MDARVIFPDASLASRGPIQVGAFPWRFLAPLRVVLMCALVVVGYRCTAAAADAKGASDSHWAFQPLSRPALPAIKHARSPLTPVDRFVLARLESFGLSLSPQADRATWLRRVTYLTTGLPPTPDEIQSFLSDRSPKANEAVIERLLASPRYGERWARHWLDVAGYADSNGYFNADSDRPLAYRYRDYVVRALQRDIPFDQFVREQIAGDELSGWKPGQPATPRIIELLEATHFLRNGQDGSGESDGNEDEVRTDRYYALESSLQIFGSSLMGLTVQCAKCHDHKFEPLTQKDYYSLQAFLYPAFNIQKWVKPNDRFVMANLPGELESWQAQENVLNQQEAALTQSFQKWVVEHRPGGRVLFEDLFPDGRSLTNAWANRAPGDEGAAGSPPVALDSNQAPAARARGGRLEFLESGQSGDRWISTRESFNWRPMGTGDWIQVTFDLLADRIPDSGRAAERIGYLIALNDFDGSRGIQGGNILIDGNPGGPTHVHGGYPQPGSKGIGEIGATGYKPGHNYGVRVTRASAGDWILEHLVDGAVDGKSIHLKADQLTEGGFGFEYCCGRSFAVGRVRVEASKSDDPNWAKENQAFEKALAARKKDLDKEKKQITDQRRPKPGKISWVADLSPNPPEVPLLKRGDHRSPGEIVLPAAPAFLSKAHPASKPIPTEFSTGSRLSLARWITEPGSAQAGLMARVTMNRLWQHYFGVGLVATSENLGLSGSRPTHPELLEWLASEFVASGWSLKAMHRLMLRSAVLQQSSVPSARGLAKDPADQWLWRFPIRRLDADSIRDATLAVSGLLDLSKVSGPYVPTSRSGSGEVILDEAAPGAFARSLFLQHRRTQVPTQLGLFDAPSIVFNCTRRAETTMPLQSLSLLNSDFSIKRAKDMAQRLEREAGTDADRRIRLAFLLISGRPCDAQEREMTRRFLATQRALHAGEAESEIRTWTDLCQMLLASNPFLYLD